MYFWDSRKWPFCTRTKKFTKKIPPKKQHILFTQTKFSCSFWSPVSLRIILQDARPILNISKICERSKISKKKRMFLFESPPVRPGVFPALFCVCARRKKRLDSPRHWIYCRSCFRELWRNSTDPKVFSYYKEICREHSISTETILWIASHEPPWYIKVVVVFSRFAFSCS